MTIKEKWQRVKAFHLGSRFVNTAYMAKDYYHKYKPKKHLKKQLKKRNKYIKNEKWRVRKWRKRRKR